MHAERLVVRERKTLAAVAARRKSSANIAELAATMQGGGVEPATSSPSVPVSSPRSPPPRSPRSTALHRGSTWSPTRPAPRPSDPIAVAAAALRKSDPTSGLRRSDPITPVPRFSDPTRLLQYLAGRHSDSPPPLAMPARALERRGATEASQSALRIRFARARLAAMGQEGKQSVLNRTDSAVLRAIGRRAGHHDERHRLMAHRESLAQALVRPSMVTHGGSQRSRQSEGRVSVVDDQGRRSHAKGRRKHRGRKKHGHGHHHHKRHRRRRKKRRTGADGSIATVVSAFSDGTAGTASTVTLAEDGEDFALSPEMEEYAHAWAEEAREAVANAATLALGERVSAKLPEWPDFYDGTLVGNAGAGHFQVAFGDGSTEIVPARLIRRRKLSRGGGSLWKDMAVPDDYDSEDSAEIMRVTMFVGDDELGSGGTGHLQQHTPHHAHGHRAADIAFARFTHAGGGAFAMHHA